MVRAFSVLCLTLVIAGCDPAERERQSLAAVSPVWNFGTVDPTEQPTLTHVFAIRNSTMEAVHVDEVTTSCGCLAVVDSLHEIPAGETVELPVEVQIAGRPGLFGKTITVSFLEPEVGSVTLKVVGQLQATEDLFCVPESVNFGAVSEGQARSRIARVYRYDGEPVIGPRIDRLPEGLELTHIHNTGKACELTFILRADKARTGPYEDTIVVRSENGDVSSLRIPIQYRVDRNLFGLRKSIFVKKLESGCEIPVNLFAADSAHGNVRAIGFGPEQGGLPADALTWRVDAGQTFLSRNTDDLSFGVFRGQLNVQLESRPDPISIPIRVWLPKATTDTE